ncbi:MAG: hypothetical protein NTW16_05490 [Bacteroidetes bacterium]|nr:hypothetical protein [Bacteroidota bacterium]
MKIALWGNMNNNFFSLLRYLRNLGLDARLFLYKNESTHFLPENDSWELEKWTPYIIQTDLINGLSKSDISMLFVSPSRILKYFNGFDIIIGCGSAPIYLHKVRLKLDIFIPYGSGVEFTSVSLRFNLKFIGCLIEKILQVNAIRKSVVYSISFENETIDTLVRLGQSPLLLGIPMVYNGGGSNEIDFALSKIMNEFKAHDFILFSHVSHIWKNIPVDWRSSYTRNDLIIEAFAGFVRKCKAQSPLLVLFEYGYDIPYSRQLIKDLNISKYVKWLPKMSRKEITPLLEYVDFGCGKVGGTSAWGGVAWEFLSKGVPFFWNLTQSNNEYEKKTGNPFPPGLINVRSSEEITHHLLQYEQNREYYKTLGRNSKIWFDSYGGVGLAIKYKALIEQIYLDKKQYV